MRLSAFYSFHSVLLVGYGIVGRGCRMAVEGRFCQLEAYDTDSRVLEIAEKDGLRTYSHPDPAMFSRDTIIIGCVGGPSFGRNCSGLPQGQGTNLYLASGSSKDVGFTTFLRFSGREKEARSPTLYLKQEAAGGATATDSAIAASKKP